MKLWTNTAKLAHAQAMDYKFSEVLDRNLFLYGAICLIRIKVKLIKSDVMFLCERWNLNTALCTTYQATGSKFGQGTLYNVTGD